MSLREPFREPPIYRSFALLAFAATLLGGTPIGLWMLAWLYLGAPAVSVEWILLHANLQILGFFATLIPGVAQHLIARFTGRPVRRDPMSRWVLGLSAAALGLRVAGMLGGWPGPVLGAALGQSAAFVVFAGWVWRSLDPPPLVLMSSGLQPREVLSALYSRSSRARAGALAGAGGDSWGGGAIYAAALRQEPSNISRSPTHRTDARSGCSPSYGPGPHAGSAATGPGCCGAGRGSYTVPSRRSA